MEQKRGTWSSSFTFILAAVGSAVGLGNVWRFPGLCAKHGGGAFLLVYLLLVFALGLPLLYMEIAIGRKIKKGAPECMKAINKHAEPIGWASVSNAFVISIYYSVLFAWVIMMCVFSFKFGFMTGPNKTIEAGNLFNELTKVTYTIKGFSTISIPVLICLIVGLALIYFCIRNGSDSIGKVISFIVPVPLICLIVMAIKGMTLPDAFNGIKELFIPNWSSLKDFSLWTDAAGQVFYSMSVMMAVMFAYGSFLPDNSNIVKDGFIIAICDFFVSILSSIVLFTTLFGTGLEDKIGTTGIATAFIVYPQAIVNLSSNGVINAIFGIIFYLCLGTLAIDSAFSITEGVSTAISDKFKINKKKTTFWLVIIGAIPALLMTTGAGAAILDIMDNWCNAFNIFIIGIFETIVIGWFFSNKKILKEINRNTKKVKMPLWWFSITVKIIAPIGLSILFGSTIYSLICNKGSYLNGLYGGKDYGLWANLVFGWLFTALVLGSGYIAKLIVKLKKKKGFVENQVLWEDEDIQPITQTQENPITETQETKNAVPSSTDLNELKLLLYNGTITQEEYEIKRKEILNIK